MVKCDAGSTSRMIDADCRCHFMVDDYEVQSNEYGTSVKVSATVLASTDPAQVGKKQSEFFECGGAAVDKLYNLAEAVGIITAQQRKESAEKGVGLDVDETLLKGRQFCGEVKLESNMRKNRATGQLEVNPEKPGPYPRIGFRTFAVTSEKAKDVPKDPQFLALLGKTAAVTLPRVDAGMAAAVQPPTAPPAGDGGSMSW